MEKKPAQKLAIWSLVLPCIPTLAMIAWLISAVVLGNSGDSGTIFYGSILAMLILAVLGPVCSIAGIVCGICALRQGQKKGVSVPGLILSCLWLFIGGVIASIFLQ